MDGNKSEVATLMQRIAQEYDAAQSALYGLAYGTARHDFINAQMEKIHTLHQELATVVGSEQAIRMVAETIEEGHE